MFVENSDALMAEKILKGVSVGLRYATERQELALTASAACLNIPGRSGGVTWDIANDYFAMNNAGE
jgi:hypothetical protein